MAAKKTTLKELGEMIERGFAAVASDIADIISCCPSPSSSARSSGNGCATNVLDLEGDNIATAQLAVDRHIEHRQVARAPRDLQLGADRPDVLWP
jgi:hypothetical protein